MIPSIKEHITVDFKAWVTAEFSAMTAGELVATGAMLIFSIYFLIVAHHFLYRYTANGVRFIKYLILKSVAIFINPLAHLFYYEIPSNDYFLFNEEIGDILEKTKPNRFIRIVIICVRLPVALLFMVKHSVFSSFLWVGETLTLFILFPFSTSLTVDRVTQSSWMYFYPNSLFTIEQTGKKLRNWVTGSKKEGYFNGIQHQLIARVSIFPIIAGITLLAHLYFFIIETLAFLLFWSLKRTMQFDRLWHYPLSLKSLAFKLTLLWSWSLDRLKVTQNFTEREDRIIGGLLQSLAYLTLVMFLLFISYLIVSGQMIQHIKITLHESIFQDRLQNGRLGPEMVVVPHGKFQMGDQQGEGSDNEKPVHWITIERFAIGRYEVTFAEYDDFAEATGRDKPNDSGWGRGNRPVINVSWYDAVAYTIWLSQQTGQQYRLPTEAEWEYAARAGTETKYWWGNEIGIDQANCDGCGSRWDGKTLPVGHFSCNAFQLCDMVGNVWEWTCSAPSTHYNGKELRCAETSESRRVMRGGSYSSSVERVRCAAKGSTKASKASDNWGFRVVRVN